MGFANHNFPSLALLVFGCGNCSPLWRKWHNGSVYLLHFQYRPLYLIQIFKTSEQLRSWAMLDVFYWAPLLLLRSCMPRHINIEIGFWTLGLVVADTSILEATL